MLRCLIVVFFFLLLPGTYSGAEEIVDLAAVNGIEKIAPVLRGKIDQEIRSARFKGRKQSYHLLVKLRARESLAEFRKSFSTKSGSKALSNNIKQVQGKVLAGMRDADEATFKVLTRYNSLYGFSASATFDGIRRLVAMEDVRLVEEMPVYYTKDAEAFSLTETASAHASGWTGKGVTIAIIDDGIDYNHIAFGGYAGFPNAKIPGGYDFADYDSDPANDCAEQRHGTAVAGVATGNGGGITGTAPDAAFVFLKIQKAASCGQSRLDGDLIGAVDWAITNRHTYGIKVISMSLGTSSTYSRPCSDSIMADALVAAAGAGLVVVAASGNEASVNGLSDPACHPDVLSVGAVYDTSLGYVTFTNCTDAVTQADKVSCYSNSAYFLDILAPAHCATTALANGGVNTCFGGTSSSTPYIAGVIATLFEKEPTLSRSAVLAALVDNGKIINDVRNGLTTPRVNHSKSLESIGVSDTPDPYDRGEMWAPLPGPLFLLSK